jgi:hypothetical protein
VYHDRHCSGARQSKKKEDEGGGRERKDLEMKFVGHLLKRYRAGQPVHPSFLTFYSLDDMKPLTSLSLLLLPAVLAHQDHGKPEDGPTNYAEQHVSDPGRS